VAGRSAIAIVGGGISGLAAAYELTRLGIPFALYDAAPRPGGVIHTDRIDGYTIDAGPDALLTQKPAALALCRALGLGARLQPQAERDTYVVRGGRLRRLPEASVLGIPTRWLPFATTGAFSLRGKLRIAADVAIPPRPPGGDESIARSSDAVSAAKRSTISPNRCSPASTAAIRRGSRCAPPSPGFSSSKRGMAA
jgi:oxygen-dependent protoporphyrinogen oxidase